MKYPWLIRAMVVAAAFLCVAGAPPSQAATSERKPVDVYLIGGQSNATGQGYLANLPQGVAPDERVMLFHSGGHLKSGAEPNTWIPLRQASESPDRFGPELGFGNRLQQLQPDRKIAIIKHAQSGSNLYRDWAPGKDAADRENWGRQFKTFVETDDLSHRATDANTKYPGDHVHFGTAGTLELGRRMAEKMNAKQAAAK